MDRDPLNKWNKSKGKNFKPAQEPSTGVSAAKEVIPPGYEEYLLLLQQRNRLLKRLKEKDEHQIEMEKKEQGFSIYVNGANVDLVYVPRTAATKGRSLSRQTKTADAYSERKKQLEMELQYLESEAGEYRAKTAPIPDTEPRKGWKPDSVHIKTEKGSKVRVNAPGKLSGKYSEDFEAIEDDENSNDDDDSDYLCHADDLSSDDDDDPDELTLSFNDVETLRKSLEADESIRESIEAAKMRIILENETHKMDVDDEEDDEIEEELEGANDSINIRDSAIIDQLTHLSQINPPNKEAATELSPPYTQGAHLEMGIKVKVETSSEPVCDLSTSDLETHRGEQQIKKERTFVNYAGNKQKTRECVTAAAKADEDLVVLTFSTSSKTKKERLLSATRRKPGAEEHISKPTKQSEEYPKLSSEVKKITVPELQACDQEFTYSSSKRNRPLSATRKSQSSDQTKPDDNVEEVLKAMLQENQAIELGPSGFRTAPESKSKHSQSPMPGPPRPSSIGPCSTEKTISLVTEKVRNMDARQQHHLISLLSTLEVKEPPFKLLSPSPSPRASPMKAIVPYMETGRSSTSPEGLQLTSSLVSGASESTSTTLGCDGGESTEEIDVNIEILSNWGHANTLGLTEIQFFDVDGNSISYDAGHIALSGYLGEEGMLGNLANGKTKTNKGRYMWSCQFVPGQPMELVFQLPVSADEGTHGLSKIVIWNFNRGVKDLNIGVKDVRIFIGGELIWEGTIDKGCGNQVFDYSTVVNLIEPKQKQEHSTKDEKPVVRSETVVLCRPSDVIQEDKDDKLAVSFFLKEKPRPSYMSEDESVLHAIPPLHPRLPQSPRAPHHTQRAVQSQPESTEPVNNQERIKDKVLDSLLHAPTPLKGLDSKMITRCSSTPNLSSNSGFKGDITTDFIRGDSAALPSKPPWLELNKNKGQIRSKSSSRSKSRPIWLDGDTDSGLGSQRSVSSTEMRSEHSSSPVDSRLKSRLSSGRSSSLPGKQEYVKSEAGGWSKDVAGRDEDQLSMCLEQDISEKLKKVKRQNDVVYARRRDQHSPVTPSSHMDKPRPLDVTNDEHDTLSERVKWRMNQSLSLEESWNVLSLFEKSHKGRITKDLDLQCHDDALDVFLSSDVSRQESRKDKAVEHSKGTDDSRLIDLEIPTLPKGKQLLVNIKSTWGDKHYVGLNGIEIFTEYGKPAEITEVTADPSDINILSEYGSDPRVATNLIDGVYRTRDDLHLWLAPFTAMGNHYISLTLNKSIRIAMIRIWNYNKSRIHSYRGARDVEMSLDGNLIFQGEIERASGTLGADELFGDTILFTMDEPILDAMAPYDQTYEIPDEEDELMLSCHLDRPATADTDNNKEEGGERPFTCARQRNKTEPEELREEEDQGVPVADPASEVIRGGCLLGRVVQLNFASTWGDPYYLGLTGLELLGPGMEPVAVSMDMLEANPRDLNDLADYDDDDRTLDKVIDSINVTTSDEHMWMIAFSEGEDHTLTIDLGEKTQLTGIRVWNYNKSLDGTFRGAKVVHVHLDGRVISPSQGYLLRKGPGNIHFDFAQDIYFIKSPSPSNAPSGSGQTSRRSQSRVNIKKLVPDYEPTLMPTGFVFQFQLLSSWGDPYYIGLNGIELYDEDGYKIRLTGNNITAYPHSVNVLDGVQDDTRTPDKLIDGVNDTNDGTHMWLAPVFPGQINLIYVIFDEPVTVSMIKVWNYSKTPIRGVQQFGLLVDDLLVYHGLLPQVPTGRGIVPNIDMPVPHHTVLFTDREQIALAERKNVVCSNEQDVQLTNDKRVVTCYTDPKSTGKSADPALRPMTSVKALFKRTR